MGKAAGAKTVFNIPAGIPFAKAIAAHLLQQSDGKPEELSRLRILLPTRRACNILREAFLELSDGKPLLPPRIQPLGDVDEEELFAATATLPGVMEIPPAISPLRRQILLARAAQKIPGAAPRSFEQALALAGALAHLMDQIETEGLEFANLAALVPETFSEHWQITISFLKILSEEWPKILQAEGCIDPAARRDRLIRAAAKQWAQKPPDGPVIAAGSTGSIPATAELLSVIAGLPQGSVILPALDQDVDEEYWTAIGESHPQYGLKHLLQVMGIERNDVQQWPVGKLISSGREHLAAEIMRPAPTAQHWLDAAADKTLAKSLKNLSVLTCPNERLEAQTVALLLREALETKGKTATVITPDRTLARRIAAACRRWDIAVDDSAGIPLGRTPAGTFLRLTLQAAESRNLVTMLSILKHEFCCMGMDRETFRRAVEDYERVVVRDEKPVTDAALGTQTLCTTLDTLFADFAAPDFAALIAWHLKLAEALATTPNISGAEILWQHDAGEQARQLFTDLLQQAPDMPIIDLRNYEGVIGILMESILVRPTYGAHPRLRILGQLEARHADADLVIMAGLNEGTWPADPGHDPWMSRPMRRQFGLPAAERSIGLAAHDFVQGLCAGDVVITRSARTAAGPAEPSRWLQRLSTVLQAANLEMPQNARPRQWAQAMDATDSVKFITRPEPRPPVPARPRSLAVTRVEQWIKDPYGLYARSVLGLKKLEPLDKTPDAAERGKLLHKILQQFVDQYRGELPEKPAPILDNIAQQTINVRSEDQAFWAFWWPRFRRLSDWFITHEQEWRRNAKPALLETEGAIQIENGGAPFTLRAKPDRIDTGADGATVIDYKSGGQYPKVAIKNGKRPQLPLEALILAKGGFKDLGPMETKALAYWILKGGATPGETVTVDDDIAAILAKAENGMKAYIAAFDDDNTPYHSVPRPSLAPEYSDYKHLARIAEWSAAGDDGEDADGAEAA